RQQADRHRGRFHQDRYVPPPLRRGRSRRRLRRPVHPMSVQLDYSGKTVVITGGTGGIGLGLARGVAHAGAGGIAPGATAAEVDLAGAVEGVSFNVLDVRSDDAVAAFAAGLDKADALVNCAGVNLRAAEYTPEGFTTVLD